MPALSIRVEAAAPMEFAALPTIGFTLHVACEPAMPIRAIALDCQIRIAVHRRAYDAEARARLIELFGPPSAWGSTLRSLLWTHASVQVPPFTGSTRVTLPVACSYDFEVAVVKYFAALNEGDIPLEFLFSGTVFYRGDGDMLRTVRVSWDTESEFRLPVRTWSAMMAHYFPNGAWFPLRRDTLDRLAAYKAQRGLPTFEATIDALLHDGQHAAER